MNNPIDYQMKIIPIPTQGNPFLPEGTKAYVMGNCTIIYTIDDGRHHISISNKHRYPTWEEISFARYALIPNEIPMAIVLPPKEKYVNLHKNCFHLWEIKDKFEEWSI